MRKSAREPLPRNGSRYYDPVMTTTPAVSWLDAPAETVTFTIYARKCGFHVLVAQRSDSMQSALMPTIVWKVCLPKDELPPHPTHRHVLAFAAHAMANPSLSDWRKCDRL